MGRFPRTEGPHFFVDAGEPRGDTVTLGGEDAHHLSRVLRARPGDPVSVADGAGRRWQGRVEAVDGDTVTVALVAEVPLAHGRPALTVVHALPRQRKLDGVVQRLTELGVDRIVPVHSERSQVRLDGGKAERAVARWRAVATAAAKQSRRGAIPVVEPVGEWADAFGPGAAGVVCWEESERALREVLDGLGRPDTLVLAVGPEGGLTAGEVVATGFPHVTLGDSVLRTETAALVAASAVRYHFGLLG